MARERQHRSTGKRAWVYSFLVHGIIVLLIFIGVGFGAFRAAEHSAPGGADDSAPVKATLVSQEQIDQQHRQSAVAREKKRAQARRKKQQAVAARKREQQQRAQRKQRRKAAAKAKANAKAKAEAKKAAADRAAQEKAQAEAVAQYKKEFQKELAAEKAQRQAAKENAQAMGSYIGAITQKIKRNWSMPSSTPKNLKCQVSMTQVPGGEVIDAKVTHCNADQAVKQSIISAIYKASPFPQPAKHSLFERQIEFTFTRKNLSTSES